MKQIHSIRFLYIFIFASFLTVNGSAQEIDFVELSAVFVENLRDQKPTLSIEKQLSDVSPEDLNDDLSSSQRQVAFWINIYNGFIIKVLSKDPDLYLDRNKFFKTEHISIIQRKLSFSDIEHGILRRSQFQYFLGYISYPFAPSYEKLLRVDEVDPRIHFGLNCGAKDCPPVSIYREKDVYALLDANAHSYLTKVSMYDEKDNTVKTTPLFSWFRGDFGGKSGITSYLEQLEIIPIGKNPKIIFKDYDWTLDIDNFNP